MNEIIATESTNFDLKEIVASLNNLLKLRTIPIGMKMFTYTLMALTGPHYISYLVWHPVGILTIF